MTARFIASIFHFVIKALIVLSTTLLLSVSSAQDSTEDAQAIAGAMATMDEFMLASSVDREVGFIQNDTVAKTQSCKFNLPAGRLDVVS